MRSIKEFFSKPREPIRQDDLIRLFLQRVKEAIVQDDLPKALAYLNRAIELAPDCLDLYLKRAQIMQYGLGHFTQALKDYRFIMRSLEMGGDKVLRHRCKQAISDMMTQPVQPQVG